MNSSAPSYCLWPLHYENPHLPWQPHHQPPPWGWYGGQTGYLPWWPPPPILPPGGQAPAAPSADGGGPPIRPLGLPSFVPWQPGDAYSTEDDPWPPYPPVYSSFIKNATGQQIRY